MSRYLARLVLWAGSCLMALAGSLIALGFALCGSDRGWRVAVSNDQTLNAALGGSEDETVSSRIGKAAERGVWWGGFLRALLDAIQPNHCKDSIERDEG